MKRRWIGHSPLLLALAAALLNLLTSGAVMAAGPGSLLDERVPESIPAQRRLQTVVDLCAFQQQLQCLPPPNLLGGFAPAIPKGITIGQALRMALPRDVAFDLTPSNRLKLWKLPKARRKQRINQGTLTVVVTGTIENTVVSANALTQISPEQTRAASSTGELFRHFPAAFGSGNPATSLVYSPVRGLENANWAESIDLRGLGHRRRSC